MILLGSRLPLVKHPVSIYLKQPPDRSTATISTVASRPPEKPKIWVPATPQKWLSPIDWIITMYVEHPSMTWF